MAQRIVGLDLGSSSITVVHLESRGRGGDFEILLCDQEELGPSKTAEGIIPYDKRVLTAMDALRARDALTGDIFVSGLAGDEVSMRTLQFPFSDRRKIEQALPFELESEIPFDIDEVVFSWNVLNDSSAVQGDEEAAMTDVIVCFVRRDSLERHLALLEEAGIDPRHVAFDALILHQLYLQFFKEEVRPEENDAPMSTPGGTVIETGPGAPREAVAFVDVGYQRTQVCIVAGDEVIQAQTLLHGGADATRALSREIQIPLAEAEKGKRKEAFLEVTGRVAQFPEQRQISDVLKKAYSPLVRRLRQIFQATVSNSRARVVKVILIGGGSQVLNLETHFAETLNIKVERGHSITEHLNRSMPLHTDSGTGTLQQDSPVEGGAALAYALFALHASKSGDEIDFRTGEFGFKGELEFVKERAVSLGAWASTLVLLLILSGASKMWTLGVQEAELVDRQIAACESITGQRIESSTRCLALIQERIQGQSGFSLPSESAADIYLEVSNRVPPKTEMQRKVTELDVNLERVRLKVTTSDFDAVDKIVARLADGRCFSKVEKGKARNVKSKVDFNVNIRLDCEAAPGKALEEQPVVQQDVLPPKGLSPNVEQSKEEKRQAAKERREKMKAERARKRAEREEASENEMAPPKKEVSEARKARRERLRNLRNKRKGFEGVRMQSDAMDKGGSYRNPSFQSRPALDGRIPSGPMRKRKDAE